MQKTKKIESVLGYVFKRKNLLEQALTHPSYDRDCCYERLEFLGDLVLDTIVGIHLYKIHPESDESFLTDLKSAYVNSRYLHDVGMLLKMHGFVRYVNYELPKLDNFVEALIGAIYLDGGWKNAEKFVKKFILNRQMKPISNYKNLLVTVSRKSFNSSPVYTLLKEKGPAHRKEYTFKVKIPGKKYAGYGTATSKKDAEMKAAEGLLSKIRKHYPASAMVDEAKLSGR
ncbi:MAG TPA: ribonuclease III domain-containing protein [bacterium]|nr:ribonuclease III domain-containing protein [bacterium]